MTILKKGACFTDELALNCPTIVDCVTALPVGAAGVAGTTQVLGKDGQFHTLPAAPAAPTPADGSETKVTAGTNTTVTGAGTTASPYVVSSTVTAAPITFATPAETIAGTFTTLAVNPADLYARENIAAQTGLGLVLSAIPAPTSSQSNWGVNTLGETLHYMPGVGWKIVADLHGNVNATATGATPLLSVNTMNIPRAGFITITAWQTGDSTTIPANSAVRTGIVLNGVEINAHRDNGQNNTGTNRHGQAVATRVAVAAGDIISANYSAAAGTATVVASHLRYQYNT